MRKLSFIAFLMASVFGAAFFFSTGNLHAIDLPGQIDWNDFQGHLGAAGGDPVKAACTVKDIRVNASLGYTCSGSSYKPNGSSSSYKHRFLVTAECGGDILTFYVHKGSSGDVDKLKMMYSQALAALLSGKKVTFRDLGDKSCGTSTVYEAATIVLLAD